MKAVAVFKGGKVKGHVLFIQNKTSVTVQVHLDGLRPGKQGFHIHEYGDIRDCKSAGGHYNPHRTKHGGRHAKERHAGDLGNVTADGRGRVRIKFYDKGFKVSEVVGRSLIVHAMRDDLGLGGNPESKKTGNAGRRVACAVIGLAGPTSR